MSKTLYRKTMMDRVSVRTYQKDADVSRQIEVLKAYIENDLKTPFAHDFSIKFMNKADVTDKKLKLGTYGIISGASRFMAAVIDKSMTDWWQLGYYFELVILKATELGLGTCWLGGTFNRNEFMAAFSIAPSEFIPLMSPLGLASAKPVLADKLARMAVKANQRKEFEQLFFYLGFDRPLERSQAAGWFQALEMVRMGPSASNQQPWRILMQEDGFDFFLLRTKGYGTKLGFDIQMIDIGIAMCHFELAALELGFHGTWLDSVPEEYEPNEELVYVKTFRRTAE